MNGPLRQATAADGPAIEALLSAAGLPLEGVREHLGEFLVADEGNGPVAAIGLEAYGAAGLLRSAVVAEGLRGRGSGRSLVAAVLEKARAQGFEEVVLLTETAREYFERLGFRPVGRDEVPAGVKASAEFQGACPDSATVMKLSLVPQS